MSHACLVADLPCTYLAHHELESVNIIIIIMFGGDVRLDPSVLEQPKCFMRSIHLAIVTEN